MSKVYCHPIVKYIIFFGVIYFASLKINMATNQQNAINVACISTLMLVLFDQCTYSPVTISVIAQENKTTNENFGPGSVPSYLDTNNLQNPNINYVYKTDGVLVQKKNKSKNSMSKSQQNGPQILATMKSRKSPVLATHPEMNEYPDYNENQLYQQRDQNMNYYPGHYPIGGAPPMEEIRLLNGEMNSDDANEIMKPYEDSPGSSHMAWRNKMNE